MTSGSTQLSRYRALSSVGEAILPRAERMHREGMTWRQIARDLKISYSALHIWRKLGQESTQARGKSSLNRRVIVRTEPFP